LTQLSEILAPVKTGLEKVDEVISGVARSEGGVMLGPLLEHILLGGGGKRLRPAVTLLAGRFGIYDLGRLVDQAAAVEVLHTATLVHDDTIDRARTRRNKPTINAVWGDSRAILLGDYLLAKAAWLCAQTGNTRVVSLCSQTLMVISGGELEQSAITLEVGRLRDQYLRWIAAKTAALFAMAAETGAILGQSPESTVQACRSYGHWLGMAFQVVDDLLDFTGDEAEMGKPAGSDLTQGILTLPAILYLEQHPEDALSGSLKNIIENLDTTRLKAAAARVRRSPCIKEASEVAEDYSEKARRALDVLPDGDAKSSLLDLVDYALTRRK
jgi:geranylgeranyl pyrophosphate synthase